MNDTQSTATITLTGRDRGRILDDLWAVTGLADHITNVNVARDEMCHVELDTGAHVAPLLIARDLLDDLRPPHANKGTLFLRGTYRGVDVLFTQSFMSYDYSQGKYEERQAAAIPVAEAALADLKAALPGGGS